MKRVKYLLIILTALLSFWSTSFADICYSDGCITFTEWGGDVDGAANRYSTLESYLDFIENYYKHAGGVGKQYDAQGRVLVLTCGNGATATVTKRGCANGAGDSPTCTVCSAGSNMVNGSCVCQNGANNAPSCNQCGAGQQLYENLCVCQNGATDVPSCNICPSGSTMQNNQCVCGNGATPQSRCTQCGSGKTMYQSQCYPSCDATNVCGQEYKGALVNGKCESGSDDPNRTCFAQFELSADKISPNGSVEFSWKMADTPGISSRCGFVDLTTPTPRPIPGLQNLDPTTDRARITNVQTTTRFCLVCQFYNLTNNNILGNAQVHQWVRVIKIGEN